MSSAVEKAYETQIQNIQKKTGKSQEELATLALNSGLTRHSELRDLFMRELQLGYGDANTLVHFVLKSDGERAAKEAGASTGQVLDEIYSGPKAALRPIHERFMAAVIQFGEFEIAPKKGYLSLRRKKQFVMVGPASNTRVEVGINTKGLTASERLIEVPAGGMCNYKVKLTSPDEVDEQLLGWVKQAFDAAG
jgi:hypothetical protein